MKSDKSSFCLSEMGSFHVGGREVEVTGRAMGGMNPIRQWDRPIAIDPNGKYQAEQMYCQYFKPEPCTGPYPMLLWHGGGLTGVTYESTPDGRPGWLEFFIRQGWFTYCCDAVERGRSGWAPQDELFQAEKPLLIPKHYPFERYRLGSDYKTRTLYPGSQFPIEAYDFMLMQFVPRWTNTNDAIVSAYVELLKRVGPSVVVAHSQGASLALRVLGEAPSLVKALVAVEPYAFVKADDIAKVSHIPVLFVWGDYLEQHPNWAKSKAESQNYMEVSRRHGGKADMLYLPEQGITGNSHMLMMEKNNLQIAALIQAWLEKTL